jgi:hypothetical protein
MLRAPVCCAQGCKVEQRALLLQFDRQWISLMLRRAAFTTQAAMLCWATPVTCVPPHRALFVVLTKAVRLSRPSCGWRPYRHPQRVVHTSSQVELQVSMLLSKSGFKSSRASKVLRVAQVTHRCLLNLGRRADTTRVEGTASYKVDLVERSCK